MEKSKKINSIKYYNRKRQFRPHPTSTATNDNDKSLTFLMCIIIQQINTK